MNVSIALGTRGNVALNLNEGSNIGGAVIGFDSSDLIRNVTTISNNLIVNQATWRPGLLTLSSAGTAVTTIALAGDYTGQPFLTPCGPLRHAAGGRCQRRGHDRPGDR